MNKNVKLVKSNGLTNLPIGIEYEELMRNLKIRTYDKYNIANDYRKSKQNAIVNNVILSPGMMIEHETNMFAPYPQDGTLHEDGMSWIGGLYE